MVDPPAGFGHYYSSQDEVDMMVMIRPGTNSKHEAEMKSLMVRAEMRRKAAWWPNRFKGLTILGMAYGSACTGPLIAELFEDLRYKLRSLIFVRLATHKTHCADF
jgi:hypothetical protein